MVEWFQYITETGNSWAGPIEKATFQLETKNVATCLGKRRLLGGESPQPMRTGVVYEDISPTGGKFDPKEGTITWEYRNYKPGKPFRFAYYLIGLPPTPAACDSWVCLLLGSKPEKADLAEMREIVAAFYENASPFRLGEAICATAGLVSSQEGIAGSRADCGTEGSSRPPRRDCQEYKVNLVRTPGKKERTRPDLWPSRRLAFPLHHILNAVMADRSPCWEIQQPRLWLSPLFNGVLGLGSKVWSR